MAPEVFENKSYNLKVDIYSFGVRDIKNTNNKINQIVAYEICSRTIPYKNITNPYSIMKSVVFEGLRPDLSVLPANCPKMVMN